MLIVVILKPMKDNNLYWKFEDSTTKRIFVIIEDQQA